MITVTATKINGELILTPAQKEKLELFIKSIPDGTTLNTTYEIVTDDGSYAQLSKVHKCIRDLSAHTGHTFGEIKYYIKEEAGLKEADGTYRSFAVCSKEELSQAIQAAITIGERVGCLLY
jgi:hypothetical protein